MERRREGETTIYKDVQDYRITGYFNHEGHEEVFCTGQVHKIETM